MKVGSSIRKRKSNGCCACCSRSSFAWATFRSRVGSARLMFGSSFSNAHAEKERSNTGCRELARRLDDCEREAYAFLSQPAPPRDAAACVWSTGGYRPFFAWICRLVRRRMTSSSDLALRAVLPMQSPHNRNCPRLVTPAEDRMMIQVMI